ncbi:MAG: alkaline phosphatase [Paludibacteraceae bacterium]|nr:alkaline phosphatase [Paludibacteraceae bacterium]
MKRYFLTICAILFFVVSFAAPKAKYVFYFIGDGMGVNQVNVTEAYLSAVNGEIGARHLLLTQFPVVSMATTFSKSSPVTDSAASGTALASGTKTYNGAIGVDNDTLPVYSVAVAAKKAGKKVGVITSVSVDHATPASFYAHQSYRKKYYEIAAEIPTAGFDFYAGSGFVSPALNYSKDEMENIEDTLSRGGYLVLHGLDEYRAHAADKAPKVLIQAEGADQHSLPYSIDRKEGDITLAQLTKCAIEQLTRDNKNGFFLMAEGGKIDWAAHHNDPATMVGEVIDMNEAVKVAYEFYRQHPDETLIVISADHETGGLALARNNVYNLNLEKLSSQKCSQEKLSDAITRLGKDKGDSIKYSDIQDLLKREMGFWDTVELTWEQEKMLRDAYEKSFVQNKKRKEKQMYAQTELVAKAAMKVMSQAAGLDWSTGGHTAGYVPVYAVGVGQTKFSGLLDNALLPQLIMQIAGYRK